MPEIEPDHDLMLRADERHASVVLAYFFSSLWVRRDAVMPSIAGRAISDFGSHRGVGDVGRCYKSAVICGTKFVKRPW